MKKQRELAKGVERQQYFKAAQVPVSEPEEGTREMGELYPFLISGGSNTERYYFTHINDLTEHKFNIRPRYFGDESSYTETFPRRIQEILNANHDAKVFCVFDWDTVYGNEARLKSHREFEELFKDKATEWIATAGTDAILEPLQKQEDFSFTDEDFEAFKKWYLAFAEKRELLGYTNHLIYLCRKL